MLPSSHQTAPPPPPPATNVQDKGRGPRAPEVASRKHLLLGVLIMPMALNCVRWPEMRFHTAEVHKKLPAGGSSVLATGSGNCKSERSVPSKPNYTWQPELSIT